MAEKALRYAEHSGRQTQRVWFVACVVGFVFLSLIKLLDLFYTNSCGEFAYLCFRFAKC